MWREEDETQQMLRESAESFARSRHSLERFRTNRSLAAGFDKAMWHEMAELGWTGILLPEAMGGAGLDLGPALALAEIFGAHLIPEPFIASSVIAGTILGASQSTRAAELAGALVDGSATVALAYQEDLSTVFPSTATTKVERSGDGLVLSGRKLFVPGWCDDSVLLVTALLENSPVIVAISAEDAGVSAVPQKMADGGLATDVALDRVAVELTSILLTGVEAETTANLAVARGIVALCAQLEGLARQLLGLTSEYLGQRVQFDKPLAHFQALRHGIANLHTSIELSGASWRSAAKALDSGLTAATKLQLCAAKARCSQTALDVGKSAIQYHGGFGYTEEASVGLYVNAGLRWASWMGSPHMHRELSLSYHLSPGATL